MAFDAKNLTLGTLRNGKIWNSFDENRFDTLQDAIEAAEICAKRADWFDPLDRGIAVGYMHEDFARFAILQFFLFADFADVKHPIRITALLLGKTCPQMRKELQRILGVGPKRAQDMINNISNGYAQHTAADCDEIKELKRVGFSVEG